VSRLSWRWRADRDLDAAIDRIARYDLFKAFAQFERIHTQTNMLLEHPKLGRPGRVKGTRELVISGTPFVVVYRLPEPQHIEILRLLHGSHRWPE